MGDDKNATGGYGNPPKTSQFKPGQSGNPKGRPKGAKNKSLWESGGYKFDKAILDEASRPVKVMDGHNQIEISMMVAIARSIYVKAAKGNTAAQRLSTSLIAKSESSEENRWEKLLEAFHMVKEHMEPIYTEIEEYKDLGEDVSPPEFGANPANIEIDHENRRILETVYYTEQEMKRIKMFERWRQGQKEEIKHYTKELARETDPERRKHFQNELKQSQEFYALLEQLVPDPTPHLQEY